MHTTYSKEMSAKMSLSIKERLVSQHKGIEPILGIINSKRISLRPDAEKWNIHDNVAHLVRYQQVYIERVQQTLEEEEPFFGQYSADNDGDFEYWRSTDMAHLLEQLEADRRVLYDLLISLSEGQNNRLAMHKKYGSHNIIQWTEFFLLHEAHHILTIFKLAYDIEMK